MWLQGKSLFMLIDEQLHFCTEVHFRSGSDSPSKVVGCLPPSVRCLPPSVRCLTHPYRCPTDLASSLSFPWRQSFFSLAPVDSFAVWRSKSAQLELESEQPTGAAHRSSPQEICLLAFRQSSGTSRRHLHTAWRRVLCHSLPLCLLHAR